MPKQQLSQEKKWYAIRIYSGYEATVVKSLQQRAQSLDMKDKIFNVLALNKKKTIIKNKEKVEVEEKLYKGYILIEMIIDDNSWYVVRNTPNVIGFVGAGVIPVPILLKDVEKLEKKMESTDSQLKIKYQVNDLVKINDGPFKNFDAKILSVDSKREKVKVLIDIFGRDTSAELDIFQIDKI